MHGYKVDHMVVQDDAEGTEIVKYEGAPKGNTPVQKEGKPARTKRKPTPKEKPEKPHTVSCSPPRKPGCNSVPRG